MLSVLSLAPEELFESGGLHSFELTSFDPNEYHILLAQTIMVGGAVIVNSMTGLEVPSFFQGHL